MADDARDWLGQAQRIIAEGVRRNPDIIIGSRCGKRIRPEKVAARLDWESVSALKTGQLFEIKSVATACAALPPGGAVRALGRPGGVDVAPTLATACAALPPGGAVHALGRPGGAGGEP